MTQQELKWAQKSVFNAGNSLVEAGLRLRGTKFEKSFDRIYKALNSLNKRLIKEINK